MDEKHPKISKETAGMDSVHVSILVIERGAADGVQHQMATVGLTQSSRSGLWSILFCFGCRGSIGGFLVLS